MAGLDLYVPVLKGKQGEFIALENLYHKSQVIPLIEAVPSQSSPSLIPNKMEGAWNVDQPYFIDYMYFDQEDDFEEYEAHPLISCFSQIHEKGQRGIPVTGLGRSPEYQTAMAGVLDQHDQGMGIRLLMEDFDEETLETNLQNLCGLLNCPKESTDLIIDFGSVYMRTNSVVANNMRLHLMMIPTISDWRSLIVVCGAFPPSLAPLSRDTWNPQPRVDWQGWWRVLQQPQQVTRIPNFGDYTIANTELPITGPATILGQLRYTSVSDFLIWKGTNVQTHQLGYNQFQQICHDLIQLDEYRGEDFSWGDQQIFEKATTPDSSPGNAGTWRTIAMNHHVETVVDQLANLPAV